MKIGICADVQGLCRSNRLILISFLIQQEANAADGVGLRSEFAVGHTAPGELRNFECIAAF